MTIEVSNCLIDYQAMLYCGDFQINRISWKLFLNFMSTWLSHLKGKEFVFHYLWSHFKSRFTLSNFELLVILLIKICVLFHNIYKIQTVLIKLFVKVEKSKDGLLHKNFRLKKEILCFFCHFFLKKILVYGNVVIYTYQTYKYCVGCLQWTFISWCNIIWEIIS